MKKITIYPFLASASVFGATAFVSSLLFSLYGGDSLLRSDNTYVIGFVLAFFNSVAGLIYFILREIKLNWLKPIPGLASYYLLLVIFFLYIEYLGGEGAGFGFLAIALLALAFPILLIQVYYSSNSKHLYVGFIGGVIYIFGYIFVVVKYYI